MTHDQWEKGERLTVNNATKDQLKWMVKDRDETIGKLYEEIERLKAEQEKLLEFCASLVTGGAEWQER